MPEPSAAQREPWDQIWANEGNVMVRFERLQNGGVSISIREMGGTDPFGRVIAAATLGGWRWDRAVKVIGSQALAEAVAQAVERCAAFVETRGAIMGHAECAAALRAGADA